MKESGDVKERSLKLRQLNRKIQRFGQQYFAQVAQRNMAALAVDSDIMLVAEAYAPSTVTVTGVNWFSDAGTLGGSGRALEQVLQCLGHTLYPTKEIPVANGVIAKACDGLRSVYTTDIFPAFPGTARAPSSGEVAQALEHKFLEQEIALVRPKMILLIGDKAYRAFWANFLGKKAELSLAEAFEALGGDGAIETFGGASVIPFLHPSGANPLFTRWMGQAKKAEGLGKTAQVERIRRELQRQISIAGVAGMPAIEPQNPSGRAKRR